MGLNAKQKAYRSALIRRIHLSRRWRAFYRDDRGAYETMLQQAFGAKSSKDLSISDLVTLADWMDGRSDDLPTYKGDMITQAQKELLRSLWHRYAKDQSDTALLAFVRRVGKRGYLSVDLIEKPSASAAITALKKTLGER